MKTDLKEPCRQCPFRIKSLPGWLGPWEPEDLLLAVQYAPFPCHQTIKRDVPFGDPAIDDMQSCAGAVLFMANKAQLPRDPDMALHRTVLESFEGWDLKRAHVFRTPEAFIKHHRRETMSELPRQDRNAFDVQKVLEFVRTSGNAPSQGWYSLVEEACHRLVWMEQRIATARITAEKLAEVVRQLRNETLPN